MSVGVGVAVGVFVAVGVAVTVGVDVATAPVATPTSAAIWVLRCASSVKVSCPVSVVPLGLESVTGLNVTETWQVEFAGTEPSQLLAVIANGPLVAIEVKVTGTAFELVRVTVCGAEIVPTCTFPNERRVGERVGVTMMPFPDTVTDCVVISALSVTTIFAATIPVAVGVKVTPKLQVPLAGTFVPLHVSALTTNSLPVDATLLTLNATRFGLVRTTVFAALGTSSG